MSSADRPPAPPAGRWRALAVAAGLGALPAGATPPASPPDQPSPDDPAQAHERARADAQARLLALEAARAPVAEILPHARADDPATRARAARALGRLRSPDSVAPLQALLADPAPEVRAAAAFALGQCPDAERALLAALARETDRAQRALLLEGLGRQGRASSLRVLVEHLGERPPPLREPLQARAAARGVGRMAVRGIEGVGRTEVVAALLDQLARPDARLRQDAAFALARVRPTELDPVVAQRLFDEAAAEPNAAARALLVRATAQVSGAELARARLYARTARDPDPGVRVATARAGGSAGWPGVAGMLADADPGVRREVIAAIGAVPSLDRAALLEPLTEAAAAPGSRGAVQAAIEAGEAVRALGRAGLLRQPARFLDPERPTEVRVAAVEVSADRAALISLALRDGEVPVRSAAAARALELKPTVDDRLALLGAFDPIVAAMGASALAEAPSAALEPPLLAALSGAENPDLVAALLQALVALVEGDQPAVKKPAPEVAAAARAHLSHPSGPVRAVAAELAAALRVGSTAAPAPELPPADLGQIRSARLRTNRGEVLLALDPEEAPLTVWNFAKLAEAGWYDGLRFHRVVPDFVVQTGDPRGDGNGGPAWTIPDEINPLSYGEGVLGMALSGPDTGGSQWFITLSPQPHLDGDYTAFGEVLQGLPVVRSLQPGDYIERLTIERVAPRPDPPLPRPEWAPEPPPLQESPAQTP